MRRLTHMLLVQTLIRLEAAQRKNNVRVAIVHFDVVRYLFEEHDWSSDFRNGRRGRWCNLAR